MQRIIKELYENMNISKSNLIELLNDNSEQTLTSVFNYSNKRRREYYGNRVIFRGLIEISNYCKNNCYYCGIQCQNKNIKRYFLSKEDILNCCREGYSLGIHSFVLQSGESDVYSTDELCDIVRSIKEQFADCALTLSIGEKSYDEYLQYFKSGADRFLLRHETITPSHYKELHPKNMSLDNRIECLNNLKSIGYQVGTGFMVGCPHQTMENIANDLLFIKEFNPHMVGIGPFIPHKDTVFHDYQAGSTYLTLKLIGIIRLLLPAALIPSTTALNTISPQLRSKSFYAGANVVMPNISPDFARKNYAIYEGKSNIGETAKMLNDVIHQVENSGFTVDMSRGDHVKVH